MGTWTSAVRAEISRICEARLTAPGSWAFDHMYMPSGMAIAVPSSHEEAEVLSPEAQKVTARAFITGKGRCTSCGELRKVISVNGAPGTVVVHRAGGLQRCPGSGLSPRRRHTFAAAPNRERCTAVIVLRDGTTADCMRRGSGEPRLCWQHDPVVEREAPLTCEGCTRKHKGGMAKRCGVLGCECYCNRGNS